MKKAAKKKPAGTLAELELPRWVNKESWEAFVAMRVKKKKPMSLRAAQLAISGLERLKQQGNDPKLVLDQSEFKNWEGLFPLAEWFLQMVGKNRDGTERKSTQGRANGDNRNWGEF